MSKLLDIMHALAGNSTTKDATATNTPSQFTADKAVATMEALQRALGNAQDLIVISSATTLTAADAGKIVVIGGGGFNVTLPPAANIALGGAVFRIINSGTSAVTLLPSGSDNLDPGPGTVASLTIGIGDEVVCNFQKSTPGRWYLTGSAQLGYAAQFASSLVAAGGHQKFPGGFTVQWGNFGGLAAAGTQTVTFPIPFTEVYVAIPTPNSSGDARLTVLNYTTTTFQVRNPSAITVANTFWIAIGKS
jgi:hypothetical protein